MQGFCKSRRCELYILKRLHPAKKLTLIFLFKYLQHMHRPQVLVKNCSSYLEIRMQTQETYPELDHLQVPTGCIPMALHGLVTLMVAFVMENFKLIGWVKTPNSQI